MLMSSTFAFSPAVHSWCLSFYWLKYCLPFCQREYSNNAFNHDKAFFVCEANSCCRWIAVVAHQLLKKGKPERIKNCLASNSSFSYTKRDAIWCQQTVAFITIVIIIILLIKKNRRQALCKVTEKNGRTELPGVCVVIICTMHHLAVTRRYLLATCANNEKIEGNQ